MSLHTGCIKVKHSSLKGLLISVMNRHTLEDGKTPNPEIVEGKNYVWHWPELGPPSVLLGDYYKRNLPWEEFEKRYLEHLRTPEIVGSLHKLIELARTQEAIVLCVETTPEHCHRRLLAEECQRLAPDLKIDVQ